VNAVDVLKYGHLTVLNTLEGVPESEWQTAGVCGVWSVKDIVAHLASFEHVLIDVLSTFLGNGGTPYLDEFRDSAEFNDAHVARRQQKSTTEVLDEYKETQAQTMSMIVKIEVERRRQPGTLPWYGAEYSLDDFIVYQYYGHKREHCSQINVFRDTLE
jgi:hypothetical protein